MSFCNFVNIGKWSSACKKHIKICQSQLMRTYIPSYNLQNYRYLYSTWEFEFGFLYSRPQATFHCLMIFLAIWDLSFLVIAICFFALPELSRDYFNNFYLLMVPYGLPIGQILLTGSIYSTLALTVERWVHFKFEINDVYHKGHLYLHRGHWFILL